MSNDTQQVPTGPEEIDRQIVSAVMANYLYVGAPQRWWWQEYLEAGLLSPEAVRAWLTP